MAAKRKVPEGVASLHPDEMIAGGLADDFDGTITHARLTQWDYDGNLDEYLLFAKVMIEPDPGEEVAGVQADGCVHAFYSCGASVQDFAPTNDDDGPVDLDSDDPEDWEGLFALPMGSRQQMTNSSNWAFFVRNALDCGFTLPDSGIDNFEGIRGHFNRIPQPKRSGITVKEDEEGRKRASDILVLTEIHAAKATKKRAPAKRAKAAKVEETEDDDEGMEVESDLDQLIEEVVVEALTHVKLEDGLPKTKLPGLVMRAKVDGKAVFVKSEKARAVKRVSEAEFLEAAEGWEYDADEGTLTLA